MADWTQTTIQNTSAWISTGASNNHSNDHTESLGGVPTECIILGVNATVPWDNPQNLVSEEVETTLEWVSTGLFTPFICMIGIPCNIINMAVFFKQGLKDRINMCLFALAVSDLLNMIWGFTLYSGRVVSQFTDNERFPPSFRYIMNHNVVGLVGLVYGPPLLSAIISTERVICVMYPLRAQRCVPTKTLAAAILAVLIPVTFLRFAITSKYRAGCFHEMATGRTSWQVYAEHKDDLSKAVLKTFDGVVYGFGHSVGCPVDVVFTTRIVNNIVAIIIEDELSKTVLKMFDGVLYGFGISVGCPVVVFFTTTITAVKLRQTIRWRQQSASAASSSSTAVLSSKEVGVTKMLICLSAEFFVLSLPVLVIRVWPMFEPKLTAGGPYANTHRTLVYGTRFCSFTSSSINFFVYLATGTKFRETLAAMTARGSPGGDKKKAALVSKVRAVTNRTNAFSATATVSSGSHDSQSSSTINTNCE